MVTLPRNAWGRILVSGLVCLLPLSFLRAHCGTCGEDGNSGGGRKKGGVGIGVTIDLGKITADEKEEDPFAEPPARPDEIGEAENPPIEVAEPSPCHCQGGRLLIIVGAFDGKDPENSDPKKGSKSDPTIAASLKWARELAAREGRHIHAVGYRAESENDSPLMGSPYLLQTGEWKRFTKGRKTMGGKGLSRGLAKEWGDCCYFDEVMIMLHGGQNAWPQLITHLPLLLDQKPVKKLVIWTCRSSRKFFPTDGGEQKFYQRVLGIVAPKSCPCQCDGARCVARDADGGGRLQCPSARDKVTVFASYMVEEKSVKLGLDPRDTERRTLTSPDGRLREITVHPDGKITARAVDAAAQRIELFAGERVKPDANLLTGKSDRLDGTKLLGDSKTVPPSKTKEAYSGPKCCSEKEGCQRGKL